MIYLLRHGETLWNLAGRLQGQQDSPLTARGVRHAEENGQLLRAQLEDPKAWRIVSSPLGRCWQTAALVAEALELDPNGIRFEPRLKEIDYGIWEGQTHEEIAVRYAVLWRTRQLDKWNFTVPGGESYAGLAARAASWLDEVPATARLIVIAHGGSGRVLRGHYSGLTPAQTLALDADHGLVHCLQEGWISSLRHAET